VIFQAKSSCYGISLLGLFDAIRLLNYYHPGRFGELALGHLTPASLFVRLMPQVLGLHERLIQGVIHHLTCSISILAKRNELQQ